MRNPSHVIGRTPATEISPSQAGFIAATRSTLNAEKPASKPLWPALIGAMVTGFAVGLLLL